MITKDPRISPPGVPLAEAELAALRKVLLVTPLGGPGSGNFGHAGRPGERGGSGPGGGSKAKAETEKAAAPKVDDRGYSAMTPLEKVGWLNVCLSESEPGKLEFAGTPSDRVRMEVKMQVANSLADRLIQDHPGAGLSREEFRVAVHEFVGTWAETSGDSNYYAVANQLVVEKEFGIEGAAKGHFDTRRAEAYLKEEYEESGKTNEEVYRMVARAQYDETQEWFRQRGIEEVVLLRGAAYNQAPPSGAGDLVMQPLSSFTSSEYVANVFAQMTFTDIQVNEHGDFEGGDPYSAIHAVKMPVSRVFSSARTGNGCLSEFEFTVLGGRTRGYTHAASSPPKDPRVWRDIIKGAHDD